MWREAMLWRPLDRHRVECFLCSHRCVVSPGKFGICSVRENREGRLGTHAYGEVIAAHIDPIEKKPLYHFLPGSTSFSIATAGCNFRCPFCQNWQISQLKEKAVDLGQGERLSPEEIVREARRRGCRSLSYTYTEPTIFFEYAYDTARLGRQAGLANVFVTNGYMTREALEAIRPFLDAANVDLKAFKDETYKKICGARLDPVLDSIRSMNELGIWVEVTTLVVPGMNDGQEELQAIAEFIAGLNIDIPWHISRFHPHYQYTDIGSTPLATLHRAFELGKQAGLHYVYLGNVWGEGEDTNCPRCGKVLVQRTGFDVRENLIKGGSCPFCGAKIAGRF